MLMWCQIGTNSMGVLSTRLILPIILMHAAPLALLRIENMTTKLAGQEGVCTFSAPARWLALDPRDNQFCSAAKVSEEGMPGDLRGVPS